MKIDSCLILSAGLGTRMGPIGELLPKPLWPIFEKKILELQIEYAKSLGVGKIYVNSHHCHAQMEEFIESYNGKSPIKISLLYEPILLGSGGGVHSVAEREKYKGNLLYMAGDQFYFFDNSYLKAALSLISTNGAVLFGLMVDKPNLYNRLIIKNDLLIGIEGPNPSPGVTFSGMGLINLEKLRPSTGVSSFFETVANFNEEKIHILNPKNGEYWDFGTSENYFHLCFRLLEAIPREGSRFLEFCKKENVWNNSNLNKNLFSYGPFHCKNLINLSKKRVSNINESRAIVLDYHEDFLEINHPGLFFRTTSQKM